MTRGCEMRSWEALGRNQGGTASRFSLVGEARYWDLLVGDECELGGSGTYLHHQLADVHHCYLLRFGCPAAEDAFVDLS